MKRFKLFKLFLIATLLVATLGASDCGLPDNCTQCGFAPGEHILTSYQDSSGATIPISGYADSNGCFRPFECP